MKSPKQELICPHCGKSSKLIPILSKPQLQATHRRGLLESSITALSDQPEIEVIESRSFWTNDAVTYSIVALFAGGVIIAFSWWYKIEAGVFIAATMLLVGIGLHVLKIILHAPPKLPPPPGKTTIKIEQQSEDKEHWLLAELDFIYPAKFYRVMNEVDKKQKWTRKLTTNSGLSQGQHAKLQDKFIELGYLFPLPDNAKGYYISGSGRRAFKQIVAFGGRANIKPVSKTAGMTNHWTERGSGRANW